MKTLSILVSSAIIIICTVLFIFSGRDLSINTSHFVNAWLNSSENSQEYLLISNPNLFMEGMIYVVDSGEVTEKNIYEIHSTSNKGRKVSFTTFENSQRVSKHFQISPENPNHASVNQEQWVKIDDEVELESLKQLVVNEATPLVY